MTEKCVSENNTTIILSTYICIVCNYVRVWQKVRFKILFITRDALWRFRRLDMSLYLVNLKITSRFWCRDDCYAQRTSSNSPFFFAKTLNYSKSSFQQALPIVKVGRKQSGHNGLMCFNGGIRNYRE